MSRALQFHKRTVTFVETHCRATIMRLDGMVASVLEVRKRNRAGCEPSRVTRNLAFAAAQVRGFR